MAHCAGPSLPMATPGKHGGLKLLEPGEVSLAKARRIADLATVAYAKHEEAYRAAGKTPPPAFQRRADQK